MPFASRAMSSSSPPLSLPSSTSAAAATAAAGASDEAPPPAAASDPLMQYVVLRSDLWKERGWPLGSLAAQAAHAATAALWLSRDSEETKAYCSPEALDGMTKVVLEADSEGALRELAEALSRAGIAHKLWTEQPENEATALAASPNKKSVLAPAFAGLKLCRATVGGKKSKK